MTDCIETAVKEEIFYILYKKIVGDLEPDI
jgi:hypothetical protein